MSDRLPFNLLTDRWLPVRRLSGAIDTIAPHEIAADTPDPVVSLEWPRPDFRLAATEFLIGLLATFCPPETTRDWTAHYRTPPTTEDLQAAFAPHAHAFALDGPGPRFMQDLEDFAGEPNGVASLLIDAPGENTVKRNTDLMVRRGGVRVMSRAAAAMALYTLQTYAPSGGAGHRTSLRGGGPLTTIALPPPLAGREATLLWHMLWANVPVGPRPAAADLPAILPWLVATRLSDKSGRPTTPDDVHPLQAWWGMPRRIRLAFSDNADRSPCDIGGQIDDVVVGSWQQRAGGTNYVSWGRMHPLSPCFLEKRGREWFYVHRKRGPVALLP